MKKGHEKTYYVISVESTPFARTIVDTIIETMCMSLSKLKGVGPVMADSQMTDPLPRV